MRFNVTVVRPETFVVEADDGTQAKTRVNEILKDSNATLLKIVQEGKDESVECPLCKQRHENPLNLPDREKLIE